MADENQVRLAQEKALKRAKWAHEKWKASFEKTEGLRAVRNLAILDAIEVEGVTQQQVADELGDLTQQTVGSIVRRTERLEEPGDSN